jgi:hypothetical protein
MVFGLATCSKWAHDQEQLQTSPNLDDCTPDDLQYLVDYREGLTKRTGAEHDDHCRAETHFFQRLVDAMRARGASVVRELPPETPI